MRKLLVVALAALLALPAPGHAHDGRTFRAYCEAESSDMQVACTGITLGLAISAYWFALHEGSPYYGTVCVPPDMRLEELGGVVKRRILHPLVDLDQVAPAIAVEALQIKFPCE